MEADVTDAEYLDVTPKQTVKEVSKSKEFDRVKAHIEANTTTTISLLAKCRQAILETDHELKELYAWKAIELAQTKEELESVINWISNDNFDLMVAYDTKKKELTPKK